MTTAENPIKVIRITPNEGGAMTMEHLLIGSKVRHFAKKLSGKYETRLDVGTLNYIGLRGNSITWIYNGEDDAYPLFPNMLSWTLPGLDYLIWGSGIIFGMRTSERVNTTVGHEELSRLLMAGQLTQRRVSAALDAVTGRPQRTSPGWPTA